MRQEERDHHQVHDTITSIDVWWIIFMFLVVSIVVLVMMAMRRAPGVVVPETTATTSKSSFEAKEPSSPPQLEDDEKTFWTKNSIRNINDRIDRIETRLKKAERPRRSPKLNPGGTVAGDWGIIRPRRPLFIYNRTQSLYHIQWRLDRLEERNRSLYKSWEADLKRIQERGNQ